MRVHFEGERPNVLKLMRGRKMRCHTPTEWTEAIHQVDLDRSDQSDQPRGK
jgi:hypothetical protein